MFLGLVIILIGALLACGPKSKPVEKPIIGKELPEETQVTGKEPWQKEWDSVKTKARKEGRLAIPYSTADHTRRIISEAMEHKFGIKIEWLPISGQKFGPKIMAETRAGIYSYDIILGASTTTTNVFKPAGLLERLDEVIFLPEVLDPKAWMNGEFLWLDKERRYVAIFLASPERPIVINTNLVKQGEIKSLRDLLDPKWKGRILFGGDPSEGSGSPSNFFYALAVAIMDLDYVRELATQVPTIQKDQRITIEWIAKGKYPVAIGVSPKLLLDFKEAGAPLDSIVPVEGTQLTASGGNVSLLKNAPHPNAAKLFINWILTKEGGTLFSKATGLQHAREDVLTDFLHPDAVRQPGTKYFNLLTEENTIERRVVYAKVAKEVFGHLLK